MYIQHFNYAMFILISHLYSSYSNNWYQKVRTEKVEITPQNDAVMLEIVYQIYMCFVIKNMGKMHRELHLRRI